MKIGFTSLLAIVFITLKLTNIIAWSWLWVLSPLWIGFAVFCAFVGGGLALLLLAKSNHGPVRW